MRLRMRPPNLYSARALKSAMFHGICRDRLIEIARQRRVTAHLRVNRDWTRSGSPSGLDSVFVAPAFVVLVHAKCRQIRV
jgi:hypothetical protein